MNERFQLRRIASAAAAIAVTVPVAVAISPAAAVHAATTITVTTTADVVADDGECSLREAVAAATRVLPGRFALLEDLVGFMVAAAAGAQPPPLA